MRVYIANEYSVGLAEAGSPGNGEVKRFSLESATLDDDGIGLVPESHRGRRVVFRPVSETTSGIRLHRNAAGATFQSVGSSKPLAGHFGPGQVLKISGAKCFLGPLSEDPEFPADPLPEHSRYDPPAGFGRFFWRLNGGWRLARRAADFEPLDATAEDAAALGRSIDWGMGRLKALAGEKYRQLADSVAAALQLLLRYDIETRNPSQGLHHLSQLEELSPGTPFGASVHFQLLSLLWDEDNVGTQFTAVATSLMKHGGLRSSEITSESLRRLMALAYGKLGASSCLEILRNASLEALPELDALRRLCALKQFSGAGKELEGLRRVDPQRLSFCPSAKAAYYIACCRAVWLSGNATRMLEFASLAFTLDPDTPEVCHWYFKACLVNSCTVENAAVAFAPAESFEGGFPFGLLLVWNGFLSNPTLDAFETASRATTETEVDLSADSRTIGVFVELAHARISPASFEDVKRLTAASDMLGALLPRELPAWTQSRRIHVDMMQGRTSAEAAIAAINELRPALPSTRELRRIATLMTGRPQPPLEGDVGALAVLERIECALDPQSADGANKDLDVVEAHRMLADIDMGRISRLYPKIQLLRDLLLNLTVLPRTPKEARELEKRATTLRDELPELPANWFRTRELQCKLGSAAVPPLILNTEMVNCESDVGPLLRPQFAVARQTAALLSGAITKVGAQADTPSLIQALCVAQVCLFKPTLGERETALATKALHVMDAAPADDALLTLYPALANTRELLLESMAFLLGRIGPDELLGAAAELSGVPAWLEWARTRQLAVLAEYRDYSLWLQDLGADAPGWQRWWADLWQANSPTRGNLIGETLNHSASPVKKKASSKKERRRRQAAADRRSDYLPGVRKTYYASVPDPTEEWLAEDFESSALGPVASHWVRREVHVEWDYASGRALLAKGDSSEAGVVFSQLLESLGNFPAMLAQWWKPLLEYWRGVAAVRCGKDSEAEAAFAPVLQTNRSDEARSQLAMLYLRRKEWDHAAEQLESIADDYPAAWYAESLLLHRRGEHNAAIALLENPQKQQMAANTPYADAGVALRAAILERQGQLDEALQLAEQDGVAVASARRLRVLFRKLYTAYRANGVLPEMASKVDFSLISDRSALPQHTHHSLDEMGLLASVLTAPDGPQFAAALDQAHRQIVLPAARMVLAWECARRTSDGEQTAQVLGTDEASGAAACRVVMAVRLWSLLQLLGEGHGDADTRAHIVSDIAEARAAVVDSGLGADALVQPWLALAQRATRHAVEPDNSIWPEFAEDALFRWLPALQSHIEDERREAAKKVRATLTGDRRWQYREHQTRVIEAMLARISGDGDTLLRCYLELSGELDDLPLKTLEFWRATAVAAYRMGYLHFVLEEDWPDVVSEMTDPQSCLLIAFSETRLMLQRHKEGGSAHEIRKIFNRIQNSLETIGDDFSFHATEEG